MVKGQIKEQDRLLDQSSLLSIQKDLSGKTRRSDIALIALFLTIVFGLSVAFFIIPDKDFSEEENRVLQGTPSISSPGKFADRLISGKYTSEIAKYYADQFPLRDSFVGLKAAVVLGLGGRENNSIIVGDGGRLAELPASFSEETVKKNTDVLISFAKVAESLGADFTAVAAPRSADVFTPFISSPSPLIYTEETRQAISGGLSAAKYIDLFDTLVPGIAEGEYLYYRTDHHWTTLGAYYGYCELVKSFGITPYSLDDFTISTVSSEFYGTAWSKAGMKWISPDEMQFFRYDGDDLFTTVLENKEETAFDGFYNESYLDKKDKYAAFLSGNNGRVTVTLGYGRGESQPREKMLIIKDSFAHAMVPFLARHFDLEIIDLRYYKSSVSDLIKECGISHVVAIYNYDSFVTENSFNILRLSTEE